MFSKTIIFNLTPSITNKLLFWLSILNTIILNSSLQSTIQTLVVNFGKTNLDPVGHSRRRIIVNTRGLSCKYVLILLILNTRYKKYEKNYKKINNNNSTFFFNNNSFFILTSNVYNLVTGASFAEKPALGDKLGYLFYAKL